MRLKLRCTLIVWLAALTPGLVQAQGLRVGILLDGDREWDRRMSALFRDEIAHVVTGSAPVQFPEAKRVVGDGTGKALDRLLADPEVDLVLALGFVASQEASRRGSLPKPVIAPMVLDAALQGLPRAEGDASGVKHLNYLTLPDQLTRDVKVFRDVVRFHRVAVLLDAAFLEAAPGLTPEVVKALNALGVSAEVIPLDRAEAALKRLPEGLEAVYVGPLAGLSGVETERLAKGLAERKIPSFAFDGKRAVEAGFMICLAPEDVYERLARRTALNLQRFLLGEPLEGLSTFIAPAVRPCINMAVARQVGVSPDVSVLVEAELIRDAARDSGEALTLGQAIREALERSHDLAAAARSLAAGAAMVGRARAPLLPQVDLAGRATQVDADRAAASLGSLIEKNFTGTATLTQVLFSDAAWAGYQAQQHLQEGREREYEQTRLDLVMQAAAAYLNLLRASTLERVQTGNLKVTLSNLDLARIRRGVGSARPAEVYRWDSQAATNRRDAARAYAQRNIADMELNRLLDRPLEQPVKTAETGLEDPVLMASRQWLFPCLQNLEALRTLRDFMASEGLRESPEIRRLDAGIAAQERIRATTLRRFYLPTVSFTGQVLDIFKKAGAGTTSGIQIPPTLPIRFPRSPGWGWSVGLNASYPLFGGGDHLAQAHQAGEELSQLRTARRSAALRVEQRVRSAVFQAAASYVGITQSRLAAEAARKNLGLVTDAYSQGVATVLDLLDAQSLALGAEEGTAGAVYNFLLDWLGVERAAGAFDFLRTEEDRRAFLGRFDTFFKKAGVAPGGR